MRWVVLSAVAALTITGVAGSRPAAGITITATEPVTAIIGAPDATGVYLLGVVVAARFSPEALHDDVRVTFLSTKPGGVGASPFSAHDTGNVSHSTAVYQGGPIGVFEGDRMLVGAKWNAYTPKVGGTLSGSATSLTVFQVPRREPAPRLTPDLKQKLSQNATNTYAKCAAFGALSLALPPAAGLAAAYCSLGDYWRKQALDPVDRNFRIVAKPRTPTALKVASAGPVSPAGATAINKLLMLQAKEIGLAEAIVTAFNRSQGAHVKKQPDWERKQVQAAGLYAAQLSALMLSEAKLSPSVRRTLTTPGTVSEEQAYQFQSSLLSGPLPAPLAAGLSKLGLSKADLKEVEAQLIVRNHPTAFDGDAFATLADPIHLAIMRQVAAGLKSFAKKAANDPLNTGT